MWTSNKSKVHLEMWAKNKKKNHRFKAVKHSTLDKYNLKQLEHSIQIKLVKPYKTVRFQANFLLIIKDNKIYHKTA